MKTFKRIKSLKAYLKKLHNSNKTIGFVPTMGALHPGHISLMEKAKQENDILVCSIFVNPAQFNEKMDFKNYPRTLNEDIEKLNAIKCDVLFIPPKEEMYPRSDNNTHVIGIDFGHLDKIMEGEYRPGHFNGVAIIVAKLFDVIEPDAAYFGEKDYQQLIIIKHLVKTLKLSIKIVGCPTIREDDGLAMSSRNELLSLEERKNASIIHRTLSGVREKTSVLSINELKQWVQYQINGNPFLQLEYFEIADSKSLLSIKKWDEANKVVACIAVLAGKTRLIDNVVFTLPAK